MTTKKFKIILAVLIALTAFGFIKTKYREYDLIRHSTYGLNWNAERIKRKMPLIDEDMRPGSDYTELTNRWGADSYPTKDSKLLHSWKKVLVSHGHSYEEIDAFRYFINDTICYQLNITSEILKDSALISGQLKWVYSRKDKFNYLPYQQLTNSQTDSVKRMWKIN